MVVQGSLSSIPAEIKDKIVGIVLYGAGDGSTVSAAYRDRTIANCAPGDFVSYQENDLPVGLKLNFLDRLAQILVVAQVTFHTMTSKLSGMTARLRTLLPLTRARVWDSRLCALPLLHFEYSCVDSSYITWFITSSPYSAHFRLKLSKSSFTLKSKS
jgi:hypothetical protein